MRSFDIIKLSCIDRASSMPATTLPLLVRALFARPRTRPTTGRMLGRQCYTESCYSCSGSCSPSRMLKCHIVVVICVQE
ncbi:uncharacterized protein K489DRAFT_58277 [Dissoconium aciculare CBS 342.82]|uniref:Uncharacterized protein n=1 Tax=Dissoconium aciculare CBS 342.82 TaxID=1314786 RepID=A0A6J3LYQ6_9PEZI|nr:uncharacterized protein K489DRAFT_58277 [Dissoconium aciculare CBS 342.82]KAF1819762.1 hypothetical protein K489DRAFT_58277 [Dissoconium aciculare CBS 342.82]